MKLDLSFGSALRLGRRLTRFAVVASGTVVVAGGVLAGLSVLRARGLEPSPDPASEYAGALERLACLEADDDERIHPLSRSRGLLHGRKSERAIVLIHGITNSPHQFEKLGQTLHERGYNVVLPRMPRHGYLDRQTTDLMNLTAQELRVFADRVVDIGAGLGGELVVVGLSAGAVVAAWTAQYRPEVARVVLIAPSLGIGRLGRRLQLLMMNLLLWIPDIATQRFIHSEDDRAYAYAGFSSRSMGEVLRLGVATGRGALKRPPVTQRLVVITNAADHAVSNTVTRQFVAIWQQRGIRDVEYYEFPRDLALPHDMIDPNYPGQRTDLVYPVLLDRITRP